MARKIATDGPGGPIFGGTIGGMTDHLWQEKLPQMVRGTNFWGTIGGMTGINQFLHIRTIPMM